MSLGAALGAARTTEDLLLTDLLPTPDDLPENRLLREILMEALTEATAKLPTAQRQMFVLHSWGTKLSAK